MTVRMQDMVELGPFDYRWPEYTEHFVSRWRGKARSGSRTFRVEHAVGSRDAYGEHRVHTVTFVNGQPSVEGVAADDYQRSSSLISLIKIGGGHKLAKDPADVPLDYRDLEIVNHADEIDAPYTKSCLALKIELDELDTWALHAVTRCIAQGR